MKKATSVRARPQVGAGRGPCVHTGGDPQVNILSGEGDGIPGGDPQRKG